ncbi:HisKA [Saitozyma podzolica]|uniref:HisKA n=1 Tax=Saitozyma podzolica TaxID=1890683 RepID=A0A427YF41_9TREE|nr:HisKA [Saitozyma podzolica]
MALDMIKDSFERKPNAPQFDVVFLDNQMPLMSGVEVAREVREMGCSLYIVGCTGNALREDQEEYLAAGADGIIPKPIHQKVVQDMIREARRRVAGETSLKDLEPEEEPENGILRKTPCPNISDHPLLASAFACRPPVAKIRLKLYEFEDTICVQNEAGITVKDVIDVMRDWYDGPVDIKQSAALSDYVERRLPLLDANAFNDLKTFTNREHLL